MGIAGEVRHPELSSDGAGHANVGGKVGRRRAGEPGEQTRRLAAAEGGEQIRHARAALRRDVRGEMVRHAEKADEKGEHDELVHAAEQRDTLVLVLLAVVLLRERLLEPVQHRLHKALGQSAGCTSRDSQRFPVFPPRQSTG